MAEDAEDIGGISVSVGAEHRRLVSDLQEADRLLESWARQHFTVQLSAQVQQPQAAQRAQPQRAAAQQPDPVSFGPGASTRAQGQQSQTALQRTINAELAKTGERFNEQTGEIEKITEAYQRQRTAVAAVATEASKPISLDFNTEDIQRELQAVLATLTEITTAAAKLATIPTAPRGRRVAAQAANEDIEDIEVTEGGPKPKKRKNIRDRGIGTEADPERIYTYGGGEGYGEYGPSGAYHAGGDADDFKERAAAAKSARDRELLVQRDRDRAAQAAARVNPALADRQRAANYLNANPPPSNTNLGVGRTDVNAPGYQSDEEIERSRQAQSASNVTPTQRRAQAAQEARRQIEAEAAARRDAFDRANSAATAQAFAQSRRVRQYAIDEEQQARVIASRRAAITGAGRTSRTLASGLGALFGGTEGRQIEAQAAAAQAARQLASAEKAIAPLDSRLRELGRAYDSARGETRGFVGEQINAIKRSDEYRGALVNLNRAIKDDAAAQTELNKISGAGNVARNLLAITAAGAAFGVGLKVVDTLIGAVVPAIGNYLDIQTGFGATSTRVTTALGQQTLALRGNVDAALAGAEAQAGLSAASADALNNQLRLTAQIKAGAQAQQLASELFRAGAGVGNAPSGLFGGYGGLGGTGLLAQQLGGGRGFSETIQQDFAGLQGRGGPDLLGNINNGLAYIGNQGVRDFVNEQARAQGNVPGQVIGGLSQIPGVVGGIPGGIANTLSALNPLGRNFLNPIANSETGQVADPRAALAQQAGAGGPPPANLELNSQGAAYLNNLNDAAERGAKVLGSAAQATLRFTNNADEIAAAVSAAAQAGDAYGVTLAQQQHIVVQLGDAVATTGDQYRKAIEQFATGASVADPATLAKQSLALEKQRQIESAANLDTIRAQQDFARPAQIAAINRQQQYSLNTQLPAQAALQALSSPALPVGTGILGANVAEQQKINSGLKEANDLQQQLNTYYDQGRQTLIETYQVPPALLASVEAVGKAIQTTQAGISNKQAAYQVAQYNFQLQIARRSLADIGGLTGQNFGAGQSYLGTLERQNLALSRQGQLLQFNLSQRQINFQTALAGFQAPGVTPEERQARIKEAQIEASFAQKQLDIQQKMFGNQVQIVDISNLRQGADLAKQIGLLLQGRQVTIDTAVSEQRLLRLQSLQAKNVAQVGTYLTRVDALASAAMGEIQQLEAAAGRAMQGVAVSILKQYGILVNGLYNDLNSRSALGDGGGGGGSPNKVLASGALFDTSGATNMTVGEAGRETVAVLRNPRAMTGSFGGGGSTTINFNGDMVIRSEADIDLITRKVVQAIGRDATTKGLRGIG